MSKFKVTHMIAHPITCSYDPARGGRQDTVLLEAMSLDALVADLTGRGLNMQSHSSKGAKTTVHDPQGGRWDCFRIEKCLS